jgi:transposase InsO family protein
MDAPVKVREQLPRVVRFDPREIRSAIGEVEGFNAKLALVITRRAIAHYAAHGITIERLITDNGSAYRSTIHAIACHALGIRHIRTRPYRPQTNGQAERFIRTLLGGWAYAAIYRSSTERNAALTGWLDWYNTRRPHGALGHKPPIARLNELNNLLGSYI